MSGCLIFRTARPVAAFLGASLAVLGELRSAAIPSLPIGTNFRMVNPFRAPADRWTGAQVLRALRGGSVAGLTSRSRGCRDGNPCMHHAAIDRDALPGDVAGGVGCQEYDDVGYIFRGAQAL